MNRLLTEEDLLNSIKWGVVEIIIENPELAEAFDSEIQELAKEIEEKMDDCCKKTTK